MKKTIQYFTLSAILLLSNLSCHRQLARVQPTPSPHYQSVVSVDDEVPLPVENQTDPALPVTSPVTNQPTTTSEQPVVTTAIVKAGPTERLTKKMAGVQKRMASLSASEKKGLIVNPATKIKKTADSKGTMGIVGAILGAASLILVAVGAPIGILLAIPGLIFSIIGLRGSRRGLAIAGVVLNALALALLLILVVAIATFGFS